MSSKPPLRQSDLFFESDGAKSGSGCVSTKKSKVSVNEPAEEVIAVQEGAPPARQRSPAPNDQYLSDREVAARYSVTRTTIWRWRNGNDHFPQPVVVAPGTTRWMLSALLEYEARMPTASRGYVRGAK